MASTAKILGLASAIFAVFISIIFPLLIPPIFDSRPPLPDNKHVMKAITYSQPGSNTSVLSLDASHPRPRLRSRDVLIQVKSTSLNPCDFKFRRNHNYSLFIRPLPKIPGEDVAGIVVQKGEKCSNFKFELNDRVAAILPIMGSRWGSTAEYVAVDESLVAKIGNNTSFDEAASIPLVGLTALQGLLKIQHGDDGKRHQQKKILIHAGAGGVGTFAIQYAKRVLNMYVATTASKKNAKFLKSLGADLVIDYRNQNFEDVILYYDAIFDSMSWAYEKRTFARRIGSSLPPVLKPRVGHYLNVLSSDWSLGKDGKEVGNDGSVTFKNFIYHKLVNLLFPGTTAPQYDVVMVNPNGKQLQHILDLLDNGTIKAVIDRKFELKDAALAYDYLERGHAVGKVIIQIEKP